MTKYKSFPTPLEHLPTYRVERKHIPKFDVGFHYCKAHWMSFEFMQKVDNFKLTEDEFLAWANEGSGYNLEVYEKDPVTGMEWVTLEVKIPKDTLAALNAIGDKCCTSIQDMVLAEIDKIIAAEAMELIAQVKG